MVEKPCVTCFQWFPASWRDSLRAGLILSVALLGASLPSQAGSDDLRDPFVFGPREDAARQTGPALIGILWDATRPLAIVGDEMVGVGDTIAGWTVVQIQEGGMVIRRDDRQEVITPGNALPAD